MNPRWYHLQEIAQAEVESILSALPKPVQERAAPLPVAYEARPGGDLLADGYEPDLLGLFVGSALADADESPLPPQIVLFLENIWEMVEGDDQSYCEEVRTTYLHELGHYLGLDEIDLEERGLE